MRAQPALSPQSTWDAPTTLKPFFTFYGSKWRASSLYDVPMHNVIVEPFAGSAGYSMHYPHSRVILVERDPFVAQTWDYLIRVSEEEVLKLPDIADGQTTDDLKVTTEARYLIGWWCNGASSQPKKSLGLWARSMRETGSGPQGGKPLVWGQRVRERIASQLHAIRHWRIIEGDYTLAPDVPATWFIDPPYVDKGKHYRFGPSKLDYDALASWCRERVGQTIVCENAGATWLPFRTLGDLKAGVKGRVSSEVIWP